MWKYLWYVLRKPSLYHAVLAIYDSMDIVNGKRTLIHGNGVDWVHAIDCYYNRVY